MSIAGKWNVKVVTPIGTQSVVLSFTETPNGIAGIAEGNGETIPLVDPVLEGNRLTWQQSVTKPMRLNLKFDVTISGDTLAGTAKAGLLSSSKVSGVRAA